MRSKMIVGLACLGLVATSCGSDEDASDTVSDSAPTVKTEANPPSEPVEQPVATEQPADSTVGPSPTENVSDSVSPESAVEESLLEAAQGEDTVVFYYASAPELAEPLRQGFKEMYGLDVEVVRLSGGQLVQKFSSETEAGATSADVVAVSVRDFFESGHEEGWFVDLTVDEVPEIANWPSEFNYGFGVPLSQAPLVLAFNTERLSPDEFPTAWTDLLLPQFKDEIQLPDATASASWLALYDFWRQEYGVEFLQDLQEQGVTFVDSAVPGQQRLAAGEALVQPSTAGFVIPLSETGAPIDYVVPAPSVGFEIIAAVAENSPNPNSARLFLNFLMSEEGQTIFNAQRSSSVRGELPGAFALPEEYQTVDLESAAEHQEEILTALGQ